MSSSGYPSVFVVDTHSTRPPMPPRLGKGGQRGGPVQTLLVLLVSVALCGMAIEACFIYRLYHPEPQDMSASSSKLITGQSTALVMLPSKPVAHLTDGEDVVHGAQILAWSMIADPLLYEMVYKDKSIVIQKEGYYHVYSKVSFVDSGEFVHSVNQKTNRYFGRGIPLLKSRKYSKRSGLVRSNSYVSGVFHLTKGDAIYVKVSNTSQVARQKPFENIFGAYMI